MAKGMAACGQRGDTTIATRERLKKQRLKADKIAFGVASDFPKIPVPTFDVAGWRKK